MEGYVWVDFSTNLKFVKKFALRRSEKVEFRLFWGKR